MPPSFVAQFRPPNTPSKLSPKNGENPSADGRISHPSAPSPNDHLNPPLSHQMNPERKKKFSIYTANSTNIHPQAHTTRHATPSRQRLRPQTTFNNPNPYSAQSLRQRRPAQIPPSGLVFWQDRVKERSILTPPSAPQR